MKLRNPKAGVYRVVVILQVFFLLIVASASVRADGPYEISWSTIDGGGGRSSGGSYEVVGTIGQPDAAYSTGDYELIGGFWPGGPLCIVEFEDYARFADNWLETGSELDADLDGDGDVDYEDLRRFVDE